MNKPQQALTKIREILNSQNLDSVLITSVPNIYYFTGYSNFSSDEREAYLLITKNKQFIFTDGRYETAIKNEVKHFELILISAKQPALKTISELARKENVQIIGIEDKNLTAFEYNKLSDANLSLKPLDLSTLRIIKENEEIKAIEAACNLGDKAFSYILTKIKPGMTELEVASLLGIYILKHGGKLSFPTIVAFKENAAIPHHGTTSKKLIANSLILLDFGVKLNNYCSDMTRTIFAGSANSEQRKVYETVYLAQQKAIQYLESCFLNHESNITASAIDKIARDYILSQGFHQIPHSLGHGIGLQVHEPPSLSPISTDKLAPGMVFSIEPGIYLPGKFGVRIEDLYVLENNKLRQITKSTSKILEI